MIEKKGISLIVTVITIIIMIIIAGAVILTLTGTNILDEAETATKTYNKQQYKQIIGNEFAILRTSEEGRGKTTKELFGILEDKMNMKELSWTPMAKLAYINVNNEYFLTLLEDGTIKEGKVAILDIADGSIELKANGYVQGEVVDNVISGEMVEHAGTYIITGTTTENTVWIREKGTYDVILNDLNIDVSNIANTCAFSANKSKTTMGINVNIYLEGENVLKSGSGSAGLYFAGALANLNGETRGSTLTIQGDGSLHAEGGTYSAGIGSGYGYQGGNANNIIINSGNITAKSGKSYCSSIGGGLRSCASNIVINGGIIHTKNSHDGSVGIGASGANTAGTAGIVKGIVINAGNITLDGTAYAIGGEKGSEDVKINGGKITLKNTSNSNAVLGDNCSKIMVTGGTIVVNSAKGNGIGTKDVTENINVTGGSLYLNVAGEKYAVSPISGKVNVYMTEIGLKDVTEEVQVTSFTTSDGLTYGIKDMYTTADGKIFVYLPEGERTINIVAGGKEYTGTVVTGNVDATECTVLNVK